MNINQEQLIEKHVTYPLELDGKFILIENVPARVNEETGEQFFAPSTVTAILIMKTRDCQTLIQRAFDIS